MLAAGVETRAITPTATSPIGLFLLRSSAQRNRNPKSNRGATMGTAEGTGFLMAFTDGVKVKDDLRPTPISLVASSHLCAVLLSH